MFGTLWKFLAMAVPDAEASGDPTPPNKILQGLQSTAKAVGYNTNPDQTLFFIIKQLITVVLSLIGVVFLGMMLWAGFNWLTAAGEKEKITKARDTILSSVIGIVIIISAYAITTFVFDSFLLKK